MEEKTINQEKELPVVKKIYSPPTLTVYGKLIDLTKGGSGNGNEPHHGNDPSPIDKWP